MSDVTAIPAIRAKNSVADHPLVQLTLVRFREFMREPEALFWVFAFPILLAAGLGVAFRNRPPDVLKVATRAPKEVDEAADRDSDAAALLLAEFPAVAAGAAGH